MTFAGHPTAIVKGGISLLTTDIAPIIEPSPIVTPDRTDTNSPSHTFFSILTGFE